MFSLMGARHTKNLWVLWGQTVPEKSEESNLPLLCLHLYNFLPLPFDYQACLQDLYSGLRIYSKLLHHSEQFGTKHICCYLGASVGEIGCWDLPYYFFPLSSEARASKGFLPFHTWNSIELGGFCSPFDYGVWENSACINVYVNIFSLEYFTFFRSEKHSQQADFIGNFATCFSSP